MKLNIDGISVNCSDSGSGDVVLILQGWGTNMSLYSALAAHLAQNMRVILPELPGFGETAEPAEPFSADDYADFVEKLLRELGITRCSLIGHSNGGRIIMKLVTRKQSEFKYDRIVFMDSAGIVHEKTAKQKAKQASYKLGKKILNLAPVKSAFPDGCR